MTIITISSGEFDQDTSGAKNAASDAPVFITDGGRPAYVLLTFEAYQKLAGKQPTIGELLAMPGAADIEFDPPRLQGPLWRAADFS